MVADGCRSPGSHTGSAPRREVVTAASDRVAKSAVAGRQSSGVGGIRADAPRQRLEWCGVFLMWEVGSCCDSLPKHE